MKKLIPIFLCMFLAFSLLIACDNLTNSSDQKNGDGETPTPSPPLSPSPSPLLSPSPSPQSSPSPQLSPPPPPERTAVEKAKDLVNELSGSKVLTNRKDATVTIVGLLEKSLTIPEGVTLEIQTGSYQGQPASTLQIIPPDITTKIVLTVNGTVVVPLNTELRFADNNVTLAGSGSIEVKGTLRVPANSITGHDSDFLPDTPLAITAYRNAEVFQGQIPNGSLLIGNVGMFEVATVSSGNYITLKKKALNITGDVNKRAVSNAAFKAFTFTVNPKSTLTVAAANTLEIGTGKIEINGDLVLPGTLDISGLVNINDNGKLTINANGELILKNVDNKPGVAEIKDGGSLTVGNLGRLKVDGKIRVYKNGSLDISGARTDGNANFRSYLRGEIHVRGHLKDREDGDSLWRGNVQNMDGQIHFYTGSEAIFGTVLSPVHTSFDITGNGVIVLLSTNRGPEPNQARYFVDGSAIKLKSGDSPELLELKTIIQNTGDQAVEEYHDGLVSGSTLKIGYYADDFHYFGSTFRPGDNPKIGQW